MTNGSVRLSALFVVTVWLVVPQVILGCQTHREIISTIEQDPANAPENKAYFAQRLLETIGKKLADAVVDQTTPREIAAGIQRALPALVRVSDELVGARERYVLLKAEIEAIEASGLDATTAMLERLKAYLDAMDAARQAADAQRSTLNAQFGQHVSINTDALNAEIGLQLSQLVTV